MQSRQPTRADDDFVLSVLDFHTMGYDRGRNAELHGATRHQLNVIINRVIREDVRYSGEPEDVVRAGYRP